MVTELLLLALLPALTGMLGLLPSVVLDTSALTVAVNLGATMGMFNGYVPIATLGLCLSLVLGLKVFMSGWRVVLFIYHQFWGSS